MQNTQMDCGLRTVFIFSVFNYAQTATSLIKLICIFIHLHFVHGTTKKKKKIILMIIVGIFWGCISSSFVQTSEKCVCV